MLLCWRIGLLWLRVRKSLYISNYQYLLQNSFYYGLIRYGGEFGEGKNELIITKKLFDECQAIMKRKSKSQKKESLDFLKKIGSNFPLHLPQSLLEGKVLLR